MFERDPTTATIGVEILPFELGYLPEFFQKKGEIEIHYTQKVRENTLREFKEAIAEDNSIKDTSFTDDCLLLFLTSRKYDVAKALEKLKICLNFRRKYEIMFKMPSFDALSVFMTSGLYTVLPWRCQDGSTLILIQMDKFSSKLHTLDGIKQFYTLLFFQCLREPMTQVNGFSVVCDLNMSLEALKCCTPENLYLLYYGLEVLLPGRFKKIHVVNMGVTGRAAWQIFKIFFSKKVKGKIQMHETNDTLLNFLPKAVLPTKYGGDLKDYDMTEWLRKATSPEELSWLRNLY